METMLTNFIDDKFLRHYNEEMKQVVIKSVDDYRKLTSAYPIVIRVDIKNIENTDANEIARCFSANCVDSKDAENFKKKVISDLKALSRDFKNKNNKYCFIYWL